MTRFIKKNFERREYTTYLMENGERKFVGRFKYANAAKSRTHFINFLVDNFTVEEYFEKLDAGMSPGKILEDKGFECYNILLARSMGQAV